MTDDTLADENIESILDADEVVTLVDVDEVVAASVVDDVEVDADEVWSKLI